MQTEEDMKVLVLGSGGREHAISWKIAQSSQLEHLYIAPGNAGTQLVGTNVNLNLSDFEAVKSFVLEKGIEMVVVGPEQPLVEGIADYFNEDSDLKGVSVIGPNKKAAQLEGSKAFSKDFMKKYNIPTAKYGNFKKDQLEQAITFLKQMKAPYVLKADGLAAGKGVLIIDELEEAIKELELMFKGKFGSASKEVVIEEFLKGVEMSVFILTDGDSYKILPEAKDYKRIGDGDTGLNTGGMGAISPVPFATPGFLDKVENQVIIPTIKGLKKEGIDYKGFLFFGLMCKKNDPYVIEYNVRMGDPETEVVMPRLRSDILDLFDGVATNTLSERDVDIDQKVAATIMMVSGGYPEAYEKDKEIQGLHEVDQSIIFHAGTRSDGPLTLTHGGRVLAVTSLGRTIKEATKKSYANLEKIKFDKAYFRKDIGQDLIEEKA